MRDKKIWILIGFVLVIIYTLWSLSAPILPAWPAGRKDKTPPKNLPGELASSVDKLGLQVRQLQDLIHGLVIINRSFKTAIERQKTQNLDLLQRVREITAQGENLIREKEQGLQAIVSQKEGLSKELARAKAELELRPPLNPELSRKKKEKDQTLSDLTRINKKLEKDLKSRESELGQFAQEKQTLLKELEKAKMAAQGTRKLQEELKQLQARLGQLDDEGLNLKNGYREAQEIIKQNDAELGKRANKILVLEEKLTSMEFKLGEIQLKSGEMEKETALLREQNIAIQLEREDLRSQLHQTGIRLSALENQASQISDIIRQAPAVKPAEASLPKEEAKRVEVELYPDETVGPGTNK